MEAFLLANIVKYKQTWTMCGSHIASKLQVTAGNSALAVHWKTCVSQSKTWTWSFSTCAHQHSSSVSTANAEWQLYLWSTLLTNSDVAKAHCISLVQLDHLQALLPTTRARAADASIATHQQVWRMYFTHHCSFQRSYPKHRSWVKVRKILRRDIKCGHIIASWANQQRPKNHWNNPRFALSLMKSAEAAAFPCVDQECPERQLVKSTRGNISFAVCLEKMTFQ